MGKKVGSLEYNFSSFRLFFTGLLMGGADLIPGVSGGTIAFILGIYQHLLEAIKSFNAKFFKNIFSFKIKEAFTDIPLRFLIALGLGIGTAIFSMAKLMSYLLENERVYLFSFFFGLVVASIVTISLKVKWTLSSFISLIIGAVVAFYVVGLIPLSMPHDPITLFLSGMVAIMAMILPGISGSFILLILGQYDYILNAVSNKDIITILPVALGAVVGLMLFSRFLSWLLKNYHSIAIASLIGFMIGSLRKIWPWKEVTETIVDRHGKIIPIAEKNLLPNLTSDEFYIALTLAVIGFVALIVICKIQDKCDKQQ